MSQLKVKTIERKEAKEISMKTLKHSKQRDAIYEFLMSSKEHPSADIVYENVRKDFPNISLGTVYRNLNLLVEIKKVIKITMKDGSDRFDGTTAPHYHFVCNECGCVKDLEMEPIALVEKEASEHTKDLIVNHEINFFGICEECKKRSKFN